MESQYTYLSTSIPFLPFATMSYRKHFSLKFYSEGAKSCDSKVIEDGTESRHFHFLMYLKVLTFLPKKKVLTFLPFAHLQSKQVSFPVEMANVYQTFNKANFHLGNAIN